MAVKAFPENFLDLQRYFSTSGGTATRSPTTTTTAPQAPTQTTQPAPLPEDKATVTQNRFGVQPNVGPMPPPPGLPNPFGPNIQGPSMDLPGVGGPNIQGPNTDTPVSGQNQLGQGLMQQLLALLGNPSRYGSEAALSTFNQLDRRMGDQFNLERQNISEDAARRGLHYSTVPVGRLGDVASRQAQARGDLAGTVAQDQARTYTQDTLNVLQNVMGYGQQQFGQQLDVAQFNQAQDQLYQQLLQMLLGAS